MTCTYGCANNKCNDPDSDRALCEQRGFIWMPQGAGGKCCGDDPSDSVPTAMDSGKVLNSADAAVGELLCTVSGTTPATYSAIANVGKILRVPGTTFDALAGQYNWHVCDSDLNSSGKTPLDQAYALWDGCRADATCRYPFGAVTQCAGLVCGAVAASDVVEMAAVNGTPQTLVSTTDSDTDGKWYAYYGTLLAGPSETVGTASAPFNVTLNGLSSSFGYTVTLELANDAQGNDFYVRVNNGAWTRLSGKYNAWTEVPAGTVTNAQQAQVQFYYAGGASLRMAVRNVMAVKNGVLVADQMPVVRARDREYLCGTNLALKNMSLSGERFVECCGSGACVNSGQAASSGDIITTAGKDWLCGSDNAWHDMGNVDDNEYVCELLNWVWSGGKCCGNDPGESYVWGWRGEEPGCCSAAGQCLVDNAGSPLYDGNPDAYYQTGPGPHCISAGQFVVNKLCDAGVWRSRNKPLADKVLKVVKDSDSSNYVLFCDSYENALAYYDYLTAGNDPLEAGFLANNSCQSGSRQYPCFNTFCVASAPEEGLVVVGGSFNPPRGLSDVEEALDQVGECSADEQRMDGKFSRCNDRLWVNNATRSFIYASEKIDIGSGLWNDIKAAFEALITWVAGNKYTFAEEVVEKADTYERFYILENGQKRVFGREEGIYRADAFDGILAIDFEGFGPELCTQLEERFTGSCTSSGANTQYVAAARSDPEQAELFSLWADLTGSLRVG